MRVSKADRELVERGNNMINACPPLHKRPCVNKACTGFYPTRLAGQRLPDPRACWACGQCEPVPVEIGHQLVAELDQLPALDLSPKRRGLPPRARAA